MDAKLKAKELVKMFREEMNFRGSDYLRDKISKRCALIAVNEITRAVKNSVKRKNKSLIPKPVWEQFGLWEKVKEEIATL